jgi:hypothetical protein
MPSLGLRNGTRLTITRLQRHIVEACVIDGLNLDTVLIPRTPLIPYDKNIRFKFKRRQFPIRLAFLMTINKSQGQTFDKTCLYLPKPVFSHGQLYVALSRVRSLGSLSVVSETNGIVNCVYNEIYE